MAQQHTTHPVRGFGVVDGLVLILMVIWGVNYVIVKQSLAEMLPLTFNGLRFLIASLLLLLSLRLVHEDWRLERSDIPRIAFLGLVGVSAYQVLFIIGLNLSTATNVSLAIATSPSMVVALSILLGMERARGSTWLGVALAFGGLVLVIGGKPNGLHFYMTTLPGDLMALGSAATWAVYTVSAQPLFRRYSPFKIATMAITAGAGPLLVVALPELARQDWGRVTALGWGGLAFSAVLSIALGYVIFYVGVKALGGPRTAIYTNLTPVVAVLTAVLILGEQMNGLQVMGAAVVLIGVYLTRR